MRAVISTELPNPAGGVAAKVNLLRRVGPARLRNALRRRDCCLGPDEGNPVPHCWQRWTSLSGVPGIGAGSNQKSPSVVALSRVASGELALPVSPPAAGRGSKEVASLP